MGEESRCHQPLSARKEGHKGSAGSLRTLGRAGQSCSAGPPPPECSPPASRSPGWDDPSPILHAQAETLAYTKTPRTTGIKLGQSSAAPVPTLSKRATGRVLQQSGGIRLWHPHEQPSFRVKVLVTPAVRTHDLGAPHSPT